MFSIPQKKLNKLNQYNGFSTNIKHTKNSDMALKNEFIFFGKFDPVKFEDKIDWNYKHHHARATYQIYLHCLHMVRHLTNSYLDTKEEKYLKKAVYIISDWIDDKENKTFDAKNSAWKDHSAASRMKNIVYFQLNVPNKYKINQDRFEELNQKHCEFLSLSEHYSENNHGMMSDEALLYLSNFIKEKAVARLYQEKAVLRMERIIYKLFSSSSYNLENSPEYHRLTQNLSNRFIRLVDLMEIEFDETCRKIISRSFFNNKKIVKPNMTYPLIGDTGLYTGTFEKDYSNFIDYQAGLAIINTKNDENPDYSSWLSFKSGYLLRSHKHYDDLSINFFYDGEDILIDSGKYTYDRKNPIRAFMKSPQGHSTIYKMNSDYALAEPIHDVEDMKINFVYQNHRYIHLAGINHLYDNINIYRDIIYYENYGFIIVDRYNSPEIQFMGQNFNLHEKITVDKIGTNAFLLSTSKGNTLKLTEHTERTLNKYFSMDNESRGFYSEKFNELIETHQIEFRKNNMESTFITSLFDINKVKLDNVGIKNDILSFNLNDDIIEVVLQRK